MLFARLTELFSQVCNEIIGLLVYLCHFCFADCEFKKPAVQLFVLQELKVWFI